MNRNSSITAGEVRTPVVLLVEDIDRIDEWLEMSRYSICEARNVFEVLERLSDFTVRERPDLIFVHVDSLTRNLSFMRRLTDTGAVEPDVQIIAYGINEANGVSSPFARLTDRLDRFIPQHAKVALQDA